MKFKLFNPAFPPEFKSYNNNGYYEKRVEYFTKKVKGTILFWMGSTESDYFLSPLKDKEYPFGTCFIFIHRTLDNRTYCVHDKTGDEDILKYPYYIQTLACDDCDKAWRFETLDQYLIWYNDILSYLMTINEKEITDDCYEFWDLFQEHQSWTN